MIDEEAMRAAYELTHTLNNAMVTFLYLHPELANYSEEIVHTALLSIVADQLALSVQIRLGQGVDVAAMKKEFLAVTLAALDGGIDMVLAAEAAVDVPGKVIPFIPPRKPGENN